MYNQAADSAESDGLSDLCKRLAELSISTDLSGAFPREQLALCGRAGVFRWFLSSEWGGTAWDDAQVVRGYLALAEACLTTTFVITQRTGACRRIATSDNHELKQRLLPALASGDSFATVGISHLTTSGRHLAKPMLSAERTRDGYRLVGRAPWVTGGVEAEVVVVGASVTQDGAPTGEELLLVAPTNAVGVELAEPLPLVALSASSTGPMIFHGAELPFDAVIAGPAPMIMSSGAGGRTGGVETSTLALGLATAAVKRIEAEAEIREELREAAQSLREELDSSIKSLIGAVRGEAGCSTQGVRQRANSLALRATQAALTAVKGRGFVTGEPVGRWCREALFFLVWSCPQPVANANLCELAGIQSD